MVAYSVVMGALMASGKEVIGRIPKGKVKMDASRNGNLNYKSLFVEVVSQMLPLLSYTARSFKNYCTV